MEGCSKCGINVDISSLACVKGVCWLCYEAKESRHEILTKVIKESCVLEQVRLKSVSKEGKGIVIYYILNGHMGCFAQMELGNYTMECCMQSCIGKKCEKITYDFFTSRDFMEKISDELKKYPEYKEGGCCFELFPLFGMKEIVPGLWIGGKSLN